MKKRLFLFLLMSITIMTQGFAATEAKKVKPAKKVKIVKEKVYDGQYIKSLNLFTYTKNNLILKDSIRSYELEDSKDLLDNVYSFLANYDVDEDDAIGLKISARIVGNKMQVTRVLNYRIPQDKLDGEDIQDIYEEDIDFE